MKDFIIKLLYLAQIKIVKILSFQNKYRIYTVVVIRLILIKLKK